jgi:hypothetical protein
LNMIWFLLSRTVLSASVGKTINTSIAKRITTCFKTFGQRGAPGYVWSCRRDAAKKGMLRSTPEIYGFRALMLVYLCVRIPVPAPRVDVHVHEEEWITGEREGVPGESLLEHPPPHTPPKCTHTYGDPQTKT